MLDSKERIPADPKLLEFLCLPVPRNLMEILQESLERPVDEPFRYKKVFSNEKLTWIALKHVYIDIMTAHRELANAQGLSLFHELIDKVETGAFYGKIVYPLMKKLIMCKWLFYRIWDPNGRGTWVQPVFDTDRMTADQFESAFTALCYKDYEELREAVPRQIAPEPTCANDKQKKETSISKITDTSTKS